MSGCIWCSVLSIEKEVKPLTILIGLAFFGIFGSWIGIFRKGAEKMVTMQDYIYEEKEVLSTILKKNDFSTRKQMKKQRIC